MQKPNSKKHSWHNYGTSGAALEFSEKRWLVVKLWEQHIIDFYSGSYIHIRQSFDGWVIINWDVALSSVLAFIFI